MRKKKEQETSMRLLEQASTSPYQRTDEETPQHYDLRKKRKQETPRKYSERASTSADRSGDVDTLLCFNAEEEQGQQETPENYFDQAPINTNKDADEVAKSQEIKDVETTRDIESFLLDPKPTQPQGERVKPTILAELKISETRDSITRVDDRKMIFIDIRGNPIDRGTQEMKKEGKLPRYDDLMMERAKLKSDSGKYIIFLPIKEDRNIPITPQNLLNALRSLQDVVNENNGFLSASAREILKKYHGDTRSRSSRRYLWKIP
jgi:hypothetical protein